MSTRRMILDLSKQFVATQTVRIGLGDHNGTTIVATINDSGIPADLTGMEAILLASVSGCAVALPCTIDGSDVTCQIDERQFTANAEFAYISFDDGERVYSTERFRIVTLSGNTR